MKIIRNKISTEKDLAGPIVDLLKVEAIGSDLIGYFIIDEENKIEESWVKFSFKTIPHDTVFDKNEIDGYLYKDTINTIYDPSGIFDTFFGTKDYHSPIRHVFFKVTPYIEKPVKKIIEDKKIVDAKKSNKTTFSCPNSKLDNEVLKQFL